MKIFLWLSLKHLSKLLFKDLGSQFIDKFSFRSGWYFVKHLQKKKDPELEFYKEEVSLTLMLVCCLISVNLRKHKNILNLILICGLKINVVKARKFS